MDKSTRPGRRPALLLLLLALMLLLGPLAVWWWFGRVPVRASQSQSADEEIPPPPTPAPAPARPPVARVTPPHIEPEVPPPVIETPPPQPDVEANLPPLTRFRGKVLEADNVPKLLGGLNHDEAARVYSVLKQLKSDYAGYAKTCLERELDAAEIQSLIAAIQLDFKAPDIDSQSFRIEKGTRVQLWLREGVKLPGAEDERRAPKEVPFLRRLQDKVSTSSLSDTLDAIEQEFGRSEIGRGENLPVDMVIFADQDRFLQFADQRLNLNVPSWCAGFYTSNWDVICAPVLEGVSLAEVLRHELFHAYQGRVAPTSLLVPWFSEGTACWLDKVPQKGKLATHEGFRAGACGYLLTLIEGELKLDLEHFLQLSLANFYSRPALNYLLAYCFVDFLRNVREYQPVYADYWRGLKDDLIPEKPYKRVFGRLDMKKVEKDFIDYLHRFRRHYTPVRLAYDAHVQKGDNAPTMPETPGDSLARPPRDDGISDQWYEVMIKLAEAGFIYEGPSLAAGDYQHLIIAIDSSVSMSREMDWRSIDVDAFARWITVLEVLPRLKLTRRNVPEPAPAPVLALLVEAVMTNKLDRFSKVADIEITASVLDEIKLAMKRVAKEAKEMSRGPQREICRLVSEKLAAIWAPNAESISIVDFNTKAEIADIPGEDAGAIAGLFKGTERNAADTVQRGADTDWLLALTRVLNPSWQRPATGTAVLFFTDGPHSSGLFAHNDVNRDDKAYFADLGLLCKQVADMVKSSGLDEQRTVFQFFALPGAGDQGLETIARETPGGIVDDWLRRFAR